MEVVPTKKQSPRRRAQVKNGYKKTTITIPHSAHRKFESWLKKNPGLSMSAFLTEAGEKYLAQ